MSKRKLIIGALLLVAAIGLWAGNEYWKIRSIDYGNVGKEFAKYFAENPGALHALEGKVALDNEDYQTAITRLRLALKELPEDARCHALLGRAYKGNGQIREAVETLSRAIELDPEASNPYLYLGLSLFSLGDTKSGVDAFRKFLEYKTPEDGYDQETIDDVSAIVEKARK